MQRARKGSVVVAHGSPYELRRADDQEPCRRLIRPDGGENSNRVVLGFPRSDLREDPKGRSGGIELQPGARLVGLNAPRLEPPKVDAVVNDAHIRGAFWREGARRVRRVRDYHRGC
jgi:hypothetical protein